MKIILSFAALLLIVSCGKTREDNKIHELNYADHYASGEVLGEPFSTLDCKVNKVIKGLNIINSANSDSIYQIKFFEEVINCVGQVEKNVFVAELNSNKIKGYNFNDESLNAYFTPSDKNKDFHINQGGLSIQEIINDTIKGLVDLYYNKHNHLSGYFSAYFCDTGAFCIDNDTLVHLNFLPENMQYTTNGLAASPQTFPNAFVGSDDRTIIMQVEDTCAIGLDSSYLTFIMPANVGTDVYCIENLSNVKMHLNLGEYDTIVPMDTFVVRDSSYYLIDSSIVDSITTYDTTIITDTFQVDTVFMVDVTRTRYLVEEIEKGGLKITLNDNDFIEGDIEFHINDQKIAGPFIAKKCN